MDPLNYNSPSASPPPSPNRWWKVLLRICAGAVAGAAACILGVLITGTTHLRILAPIPFLTLLTVALYVAIRERRFGYTTGLIIAPFLIAAALVLLLIAICSHLKI